MPVAHADREESARRASQRLEAHRQRQCRNGARPHRCTARPPLPPNVPMPLVRVPGLALCSTPASNPPSVRTSLVASLVASQVVLEDDVELTTSAHAVSSDIHKCDALGAAGGVPCFLLLLCFPAASSAPTTRAQMRTFWRFVQFTFHDRRLVMTS